MEVQWLSLNEDGEHCELISSEECVIPNEDGKGTYSTNFNSRFARDFFYPGYGNTFKIHARPQFLEPQIAYKVNLVCKSYSGKNDTSKQQQILSLKYKLEGEENFRWLSMVHGREDGWFTAELCHVTSETSNFDLEILMGGISNLVIQGIEFRPLEKVDLEEDDKKLDMQLVSDSNTQDWEQKLPDDYDEIIKWSKDGVEWTTNKELYFLLRKGFLINNGAEWFSLADNGKKCYMLPARAALVPDGGWSCLPVPESRFKEVADCTKTTFNIICDIKSHLLSRKTTYASYIIYKAPETYIDNEDPLEVHLNGWEPTKRNKRCNRYVLLHSPRIPVVKRNGGKTTLGRPKESRMEGMPKRRDDGLMEVQVWEFRTGITSTEKISMHLGFHCKPVKYIERFMIEGIEFRPM